MSENRDENFQPAWPPQDDAIRQALVDVYESGEWGRYEGRRTARLTAACEERFQVAHALPCSSGTIAVELALRGAGIGDEDEVILAGYDFAGNFRCIDAVGGRPVLVDLAPGRWILDLARVAEAITEKTRAIIASHLHGDLAPVKQLRELADAHGIKLIEDACQSPGAIVDGRPVCAWGHAATLSFGGSKLLTSGRGGMVLTEDPQIRQRIVIASQQGNNAHPLSELQAAVLLPQLVQLEKLNQLRLERFQAFTNQLRGLPVHCVPVADTPERRCATFRWGVRLGTDVKRSDVGAKLNAAGIPLESGFRGFTQRSRSRCRQAGDLTNAKEAAEQTLLLHHGVLLRDAATRERLSAAVANAITACMK